MRLTRSRFLIALALLGIAVVVAASIHASHIVFPNAWLPASSGEFKAPANGTQVDVHRYDGEWFDAAWAGRQDIIQALLDAGYPVNSRNANGHTALTLGAYHGYTHVVTALLGAGADPCLADVNGNTALMGALYQGYDEVAWLLISDCPVDQANGSGETALAFAAMFDRSVFIPVLLKRGADSEHRDRQGHTPQQVAQAQGAQAALAALHAWAAHPAAIVVKRRS